MSLEKLIDYYVDEIRNAIKTENELSEFNGYCDIAAFIFEYIFCNYHSLNAVMISGVVETADERKGHYWNKLNDQIIDLTADQFGLEYGVISKDDFDEFYIGSKETNILNDDIILQMYLPHIKIYKECL